MDDSTKAFLMNSKDGTPRTLDEAIQAALCVGPLKDVRERSYHVMRDFMAQKFGVAYLELAKNEEALKVFERLFHALTARHGTPADFSQLKKSRKAG